MFNANQNGGILMLVIGNKQATHFPWEIQLARRGVPPPLTPRRRINMKLKRRKNQLINMADANLELPNKDDLAGRKIYQNTYQQEYKKRYKKVTKKIEIELREDEHLRLKKIAKEENIPLSKLILYGYYETEKKRFHKDKSLRDIMTELSRMGNNMNQIAYQLNTKKKLFLKNPSRSFDQMRDAFIGFCDRLST